MTDEEVDDKYFLFCFYNSQIARGLIFVRRLQEWTFVRSHHLPIETRLYDDERGNDDNITFSDMLENREARNRFRFFADRWAMTRPLNRLRPAK